MHQPSTGPTYRDPPKMIVSVTLMTVTVGLVGLLSAVMMAPAVAGAFVAGATTAALVTFISLYS